MGKLIAGLLIGLVVGCAATFYFVGGVPRASRAPGVPIKPPDAIGQTPGTAQIALREEFFNGLLGTIFRDMNPPSFPLSLSGEGSPADLEGPCPSKITLLPEGSGTQTGIIFDNSKINAPLAFSGSYNSMLGCLQFTGWAQSNFEMRYDASQQAVFGQLNVETINLDGVNPVASGLLTPLVQATLNNRVNPIPILRGEQIAINLPVAATKGNLKGDVKDVRAEVKDRALNLYVIYEFNGKG